MSTVREITSSRTGRTKEHTTCYVRITSGEREGFVVGEEVLWGSDRIGYLRDHLTELRMARL